MKTHELANALRALTTILKNGPNVDIDELKSNWQEQQFSNKRSTSPPKTSDIPIALSALLSLSSIDKREWSRLISDLGLEIEIRPRDASRDIVGKVLRLLENDPRARDQLSKKVSNQSATGSPELARALSSLLGL